MTSSDDSDSEESGMKYLASCLLETVTGMTRDVLSSFENTSRENSEIVIETGMVAKANLKKFLESALINSKDLGESLTIFIDHYKSWSRKQGRMGVDKKQVMEYRLTMEELLRKLGKDKPPLKAVKRGIENEESALTGSGKTPSTPKTPQEGKDKPPLKAVKRGIENEESALTGSGKTPSTPKTPQEAISKKIKFAKLSPKLDLFKTFQCHICPKKFDWLKSLTRHLKKDHGSVPVEGVQVEVKDFVTCRMCKRKQKRDKMRSHLSTAHGVEKKGSSAILRGFVTVDEQCWQPLFLEKGENDPEEETELMLRVQDGVIDVFGVKFNVEETNIKMDEGESSPLEPVIIDDQEIQVTKGAGEESKSEPEECHSQHQNASGSVVTDNHSEIGEKELVDSNLSPKVNVEETNIKMDEEESESSSLEAVTIDDQEIQVTKGAEAESKSEPEDYHSQLQNASGRLVTDNHSVIGEKELVDSNLSPDAVSEGATLGDPVITNRVRRMLWEDDEIERASFCEDLEPEEIDRKIEKRHGSRGSLVMVDLGFTDIDGKEEDTEEIFGGDDNPLPKIKVQTFLVEVDDGEFWTADSADAFEVSTNFEDGLSKDDCEYMNEMRKIRLARRNNLKITPKLTDVEENSTFIKKFEAFLVHSKIGSAKEPRDLSSFKKHIAHLFTYEDSFLNFMTIQRGSEYNLSRHLNPNTDDFMELPDPTVVGEWVPSMAGESGKEKPSRRKECLKAHSRLRDFLIEELENTDFGNSAEGFIRKDAVLKKIQNIGKKISERNLFDKLKRLEDQERFRKQEAREIVFPSNNFNEQQAVKKWFSSDICKDEEKFCENVYNKCISGGKVNGREFVRLGNFTRFQTAIEDRNRRSVYSLTNKEFDKKRPKWLPTVDMDESTCIVDRFELLPDGWNADEPQRPGLEASCWAIRVQGEKLKGGKDADIILTRRSHELCLRYQEVKDEMIGEVSNGDCFFVNAKNKPLAPLQRTPGSLLSKYGQVTGVHKPTVNSLRRAMEPIIQASPMKQVIGDIQSHSATVGQKYYDRTGQNTRAHFVTTLASLESPLKDNREVPEHVKAKRKEKERAAKEKAIEEASALLEQDKRSKTKNFKSRVGFGDREFLQKLFSSRDLGSSNKFPEDSDWVKYFYQGVDSLPGSDGEKLRFIEERVFKEFIRKEVEKELGVWNGSREQNKLGDWKTALCIKSSFKVYEKSKDKYQKSYFKF